MSTHQIHIVNAFIDGERGGNPAGIILDADALTTLQKQTIAQKVGLSETAFVSSSSIADVKLEFFTPTRQIPHCGHATIAVFSYLSQTGRLKKHESSKETIDGIRKIMLDGDMAFMEQTAPRYSTISSLHKVFSSLGVQQSRLIPHVAPFVVNTGNSFLIIGLQGRVDLKALTPDFKLIEKISEALDLIGFYVFTRETHHSHRHASARMFAPRYGIPEEAATGMAAGPLACYLHDHLGITDNELLMEQGYFMSPPSPSLLKARLQCSGKNIQSLMVGGRAQFSHERAISL